jgi:hypothetical protein
MQGIESAHQTANEPATLLQTLNYDDLSAPHAVPFVTLR